MSSGNIKKFELKLGRTGMIITVAGMAVLLCGSFILGVSVGKNINTYPEKISSTPQHILSFFWRPAKVASRQSGAESGDASAGKGNIDLAFHNTLTGSKTLPIQPPAAEKVPEKEVAIDQNAAAPAGPEPKTQKEEDVARQEVAPSGKDVIAEKIIAANKSQKKEESVAPVSTGASYFIHVASVKDKSKADQVNKAVADLGYKSKVVKTDVKGKGIWYRIIATGFETKAQAKAAVDKISKKVKTTCIIRQAGMDADKTR